MRVKCGLLQYFAADIITIVWLRMRGQNYEFSVKFFVSILNLVGLCGMQIFADFRDKS